MEWAVTLSMTISDQAERQLREWAQRTHLSPEALAARLIERSLQQPFDLVALSSPVAAAFKGSGMTDDELSEFLEKEKHAARADRRKKAS